MYDCSICGGGKNVIYNYHYDPPLLLCCKCKYGGTGKHKLVSCSICDSKTEEFLLHNEHGFICKPCGDFLCAGFKFYKAADFCGENNERFDCGCDGCVYYKGGVSSRYECNILARILYQQEYSSSENRSVYWFLEDEVSKLGDKIICRKKSL